MGTASSTARAVTAVRVVQRRPQGHVRAAVVADHGEPLVPEGRACRARQSRGHGPLGIGRVVGGGRPAWTTRRSPAGRGRPPCGDRASSGATRCQVAWVRGCPCSSSTGGPDPPWRTRSSASPTSTRSSGEPVEHRAPPPSGPLTVHAIMKSTNMVQQKHNHQSRGGRAGSPTPGSGSSGSWPTRCGCGWWTGSATAGRPRSASWPASSAVRSPSSPTTCGGCARSGLVRVERAAARPSTSSATPGSSSCCPCWTGSPATCGRWPGRRLAASGPATTTWPGRWGSACTAPWSADGALEERPDGTVEPGETAARTLAALGVDVAGVAPGRRRLRLPVPRRHRARPPPGRRPRRRRRRRPAQRRLGRAHSRQPAPSSSPRPGPAACGGRSA